MAAEVSIVGAFGSISKQLIKVNSRQVPQPMPVAVTDISCGYNLTFAYPIRNAHCILSTANKTGAVA